MMFRCESTRLNFQPERKAKANQGFSRWLQARIHSYDNGNWAFQDCEGGL